MIYDTFFYISSMARVYIATTLILFVFPMFTWRHYLSKKTYKYRYLFCLVTQNCFLINLVLLLGILEICNRYTVLLGLLLEFIVVRWKFPGKRRIRHTPVTVSIKQARVSADMWLTVRRAISRMLGSAVIRVREWRVFGYIRKNWPAMLLMTAALAYNAFFLTHNVNIDHSYQFSDIPVHQSWIYFLEHGTLFSAGIYPFGMHSVIYVIRVLTGINLREILLYYGSYQTLMLMLCVYCLARKIFSGRYMAFLPVLLFSLLQNNGRYAASLPQECGVFAAVTTAYFMIELLQSERKPRVLKSDSKAKRFFRINQYFFRRYLTTDVILLMLSVAVVIAYHFYTAIAAVIAVFAIAVAYLPRVIKKQYWVPLCVAGFMGAVIAIAPMGICLAKGIPFQESMAWATSVIKGETWEGTGSDYLSILEQTQAGEDAAETDQQTEEEAAAQTETAEEVHLSPKEFVLKLYNAILHFGNDLIYGETSAKIMLLCIAIGIAAAIGFIPFKSMRWIGPNYVAMGLYVLIVAIMGRATELNIVNIMAESRASAFVQPLLFIVYTIPFDVVYRLADRSQFKWYQVSLQFASVAVCGVCALFIINAGRVHNYFDVNMAYYNEPEYVLRHIKEDFTDDSFIVVSPTEEYYEVIDYGYHTELSEFVNMLDGKQQKFTFPSRYVFFFIEKVALQDYYLGAGVHVAPEHALKDFVYMASNQDYYFQRVILESKAYYWAQTYAKVYPNSFSLYYEDDIYVVYMLEQNVNYPYDLNVDYISDLKALAAGTEVTP